MQPPIASGCCRERNGYASYSRTEDATGILLLSVLALAGRATASTIGLATDRA